MQGDADHQMTKDEVSMGSLILKQPKVMFARDTLVVLPCLGVRPGSGRMEGEEQGAHLAHAHVVAEGAVDDRGVVIDIQDVHS